MLSCNIASHLPTMAAAQPETLAVAMQNADGGSASYTYRQLDEESDLIARGLQEAGIVKGTRTVLMVRPGLAFFALSFALFKIGAVLVAVDPGLGLAQLKKCLQEAAPEAFIGIRKAHLARWLRGWAKDSLQTCVVVESWPLLGLVMQDLCGLQRLGRQSTRPAMNTVEAADAAAILFTSGSTGSPKGVNYTHGNFSAQLEALKTLYGIEAGEVDLATFPLFALFAPAMGMSAVIPDMDFTRPATVDPAGIARAVNEFAATTMFGSPALLNRVSRWGVAQGQRLPSLRRVISAGAPVAPAVLQRFTQLLSQDAEIFTPYGATEALPVASIGSREVLADTGRQGAEGKGTCVGRPLAGTSVHIIAISDDALPDWSAVQLLPANEVGEIIVQGPQVTASYYNNPMANKLAKILDGKGGFYHRMGDLGYFDGQGRLWFCGRKSERVVLGEMTLFTVCCEGVFNSHARVYRSALVTIHVAGAPQAALCIELEADSRHTNHKALIEELRDLGRAHPHTAGIRHFFVHPGFPVDIRHNAKIGRAELATWAELQS